MKWLIFTLVMLVSFPCLAPTRVVRGNSEAAKPIVSGGGCATTDTVLAHDVFLFGWESGDSGTWTSWVGTDTVTYNTSFDTSALTTGKPSGACDVGVEVAVSTTSGDESLFWDLGSTFDYTSNPLDTTFYIYVTTAMDSGENFTVVSLNTSTTGSGSISAWVNLRNNAGTLEMQCEASSSSAWVALTANSWNKVRVRLLGGASASFLDINDAASPATFTSVGNAFRYFHYGAVQNHAANEACTYIIDLVAINTP